MLAENGLLPTVSIGELTVVGSPLAGESGANEVGFFGGELLDRMLVTVWFVTTLTLASLVTGTTVRLIRERRSWLYASVAGQHVLVSENVGPALVGFWNHALVIPRWVLDLSDEEQRLVVLHEAEHARANDLYLLLGGLLALVLLPWNPAIWWQVRRLRLAAEADCDARVLGSGAEPRLYGEFLLNVCSKARSPRVATVALSERRSPLLRRIELMTAQTRGRTTQIVIALATGGIAFSLACEVPAPVIAPAVDNSVTVPQTAEVAGVTGRVYSEYEVDEPPRLVARPPFEYPQELLDESAEGVVQLETVVGIDGNLEPGSSRVTESTDDRFNDAALHYLNRLGFAPGLVDGEPVRVLIRMPIQFSIVGGD